MRVSSTGADKLREVLEDIGEEISLMAKDIAKHAKRKTVRGDDIELAFKQWRRRLC